MVPSLRFTSDGKCIILGLSDESTRIWDMETGVLRKILGEIQTIPNFPFSTHVAISADGNWTAIGGVWTSNIKIWDIGNKVKVGHLDGYAGGSDSLVLSHDGTGLVSSGPFSGSQYWDLAPVVRAGTKIRGMDFTSPTGDKVRFKIIPTRV